MRKEVNFEEFKDFMLSRESMKYIIGGLQCGWTGHPETFIDCDGGRCFLAEGGGIYYVCCEHGETDDTQCEAEP